MDAPIPYRSAGAVARDRAHTADADDLAVDRQLALVAELVNVRIVEVSDDVQEHLIATIPELRGDEWVVNLLAASVEANIATALHIFEHSIVPEELEAPAAALEYARRLAQRGVPLHALVRSYRVGHARFLRWCLAELTRQVSGSPQVAAVIGQMLDLSFRYIDRISERMITVYQHERDRWLLTQTAARAARVRSLLAEEHADVDAAESALGYRLRQHHLGVVSWIPEPTQGGQGLARLDRLSGSLAKAVGGRGRPLFVPCDESVAWSWLPAGRGEDVAYDVLSKTVEQQDPSARIAVGEPAAGVEGFRQTHRQALRAQDVANVARPPARTTTFAVVGPVALLLSDLEAARGWMWQVLGRLADDDEPNARLRETLQVFLTTGSLPVPAWRPGSVAARAGGRRPGRRAAPGGARGRGFVAGHRGLVTRHWLLAGVARDWFHPLDGARYLAQAGHSREAALVAHHSGARFVAEVRGLVAELAGFPFVEDPLTDALTYADQTVGPRGERLSVADRLAEAVRRHGPDAPASLAAPRRDLYIYAAAERTEARL